MDLLEAVSHVLKDNGFLNLNINDVCQFADVDRNAIYRHFGDFNNLLTQFIETKDFGFDSLETIANMEVNDHKLFMKQMLFSQFEQVNKNTELQQLLVWELSELSLRTKNVAQKREIISEPLIKKFEDHFKDSNIDFNVITAIIIAGIYYLILHKKHSTFCLVDFVKEKDRMFDALDQLVELIFAAKEAKEKTRDIAIKALNKGIDKETVAEITGLKMDEVEAFA
jgi:AcrR family transcriptional regulator